MPLVNMKVKREEEEMVQAEAPDNEYPFGLRLMLDNDSLEKLGLENLPEVGKELGVEAKAKVAEVSESASEEAGKNRRLELQITDLNLIDPEASTADRLFSGQAKSE